MGDRSDEATASREPESTDELLEETEELLSGTGEPRPSEDGSSGSRWPSRLSIGRSEPAEGAETGGTADASRSRTRRLLSRLSPTRYVPRLSPTRYFSPKAFLALVLVLGAGLFVGGTTLPVGGRLIGMVATAFLVGLVTAKRRYLEVGIAGLSVGAVAAFFNYAVVTLVGAGQSLLAVGTTAGAVGCLVGYYFGRDLRAGVRRDL